MQTYVYILAGYLRLAMRRCRIFGEVIAEVNHRENLNHEDSMKDVLFS